MKLRTFFLLLLIISNSGISAQNQSDDDWDKEFKDGCSTENTPQKKPTYISQLSSSSYKTVAEQFKTGRMQFGLLAGGYRGTQGTGQHVAIKGLVGDYYSVTNPTAGGGIVGLSYYIKSLALDNPEYELQYSISSFFLSSSTVAGYVTQENIVTNLKYQYNIYNIPGYLGVKLTKLNEDSRVNVAFDLGLGVNKIKTSVFYETSLTSYTLPDLFFTSGNSYEFSMMTGIGLRLENAFGKNPLECGYRFFYLGQGQLDPTNTLISKGLKTGQNYANVFACEFII
ncbi:MAG: hypothetical protein KBB94_01895 [Legionellaceae bacterium]|nr:hypothetical protein [Legionellaceae bacterium]MBP9774843.1 hypothetical protein [Legionellaceae bacterium]